MKKYIVGNWKCFPEIKDQAYEMLKAYNALGKNLKKTEIVICPPFAYLGLYNLMKTHNFSLGAQDCFYHNFGAYTGEVSPQMIQSMGGQYVIVGHSERRQHFHEDNIIVNKKLRTVIENKMTAILCVGENLEERNLKRTNDVLRTQITQCLKQIGPKEAKNVVIAYEPVWAIGGSTPCDPVDAKAAGEFIKQMMFDLFAVRNMPVLYGGSVNAENGAKYIFESKLDGLLIGRASLHPEQMALIIESIENGK